MKIDANLRIAVRACIRKHNSQPDNYYEDLNKSIHEFLGQRVHLAQAQRAVSLMDRGIALQRMGELMLEAFGLCYNRSSGDRQPFLDQFTVQGEKIFAKAGGRVPKRRRRLNEAHIIANLATATPYKGAVILRELGIVWK